jgi:hypothetical protein
MISAGDWVSFERGDLVEKIQTISSFGVMGAIYHCYKGFCVPWHNHSGNETHGHLVIAGRTQVEIKGQFPLIRTPEDPHIEFDKETDHQVTALEDGTVFIHLGPAMTGQRDPAGQLRQAPSLSNKNRVLMIDGSVVEPD